MDETEDHQRQTLRLLKAFMHIRDPIRRREIIEMVEALAKANEREQRES